jgi:hypothetical protein
MCAMASWLAGVDVLLWVAAITQLLLVLLGAIVSLQEEWVKRHKVMVLCFFAALGIGGLWATIAQSAKSARETTEASGRLGAALTDLGTSTTEIARMTTLNTQLQGKLLDASGTVTNLARQNIAYLTGGDSFCYVNFSPSSGELWVIQEGHNHVFNASVRIVDLDGPFSLASQPQFSVPYLPRGTARLLGTIPFGSGDYKRYNVFIMAPNGYFVESVRLKKNAGNNAWEGAKWVSASYYDGKRGIVLEDVKNFPKDVLNNDVDWKNDLKIKRLLIRH